MHNKKKDASDSFAPFEDEIIVEMPINGTLDLHTFSPKDVKDLVPDYLAECLKKGIFEVRIVHGKGKGVLRRIVHSALERLDIVESWQTAGHGRGSWGATIVHLKKDSRPPQPPDPFSQSHQL